MLELIAIFVLALILYWFLVATKHPKDFPPGPRLTVPILGNALSIGKDLPLGMDRLRERYGDVCGLFVAKDRSVIISDYALIQEVAASDIYNNRQDFLTAAILRGGTVKSGTGRTIPGIIFSNGPNWVEQRRYALHTLRDLGFGKLGMESLIMEEVQEICKHFEKKNGSAINIRNDFNIAVLNSLWTVVLSDRHNYDDARLLKLVHLLDEMFQEFASPLNLIILMYKPLADLVWSSNLITGPVAIQNIMKFIDDAITDHERTFQEDSLRDFTDHYLKEMKDRSATDGKSSFQGPEGKLNLRNVLFDFFVAGSETTSTTLNWAMLYMILNPEIQKKVQEELDEVTGRSRMPTLADRDKTPYTEAVIHEIQRCGNIAPIGVTHCSTADSHLKGYFIPRGTNIFLNMGHVMKSPNNFPDPEKFDPLRFLTKEGKFKPHPMVIPFGLGKRRCLGEILARSSLYLFFTGIVSTFTLTKENDKDYLTTEPFLGGTLSPQPYKMRFIPRK